MLFSMKNAFVDGKIDASLFSRELLLIFESLNTFQDNVLDGTVDVNDDKYHEMIQIDLSHMQTRYINRDGELFLEVI